jgi:hypothetical protein
VRRPSQAAPAVVTPNAESEIKETSERGPFTPAGLREAYDLPSETAGAGQTVGIVDAFNDPDAESDLAKYRSHFGLSPCTTANGCFRKVNQSGGTSPYPNSVSIDWTVEESLDVDMVSAVCPKCHILLVEATNDEYANLAAAEDEAVTLGATEINDSWGGPEFSGESQYDPHFDHPGVPITVAAGDTGDVVTYPAATPYVIAVGGTVLERTIGARGWREAVWGGEGKAGTGSGCSVYEPKPAWQTDTGCGRRTDNDIAAVASTATPVWVVDSWEDAKSEIYPGEDPGWILTGGTSGASAIMSGIMALTNEYTRSFPGAEAFYREAAQNGVGDGVGVLDDVVTGLDGTCANYLCEAIPGYDGPTGLGSPYGAPVVFPAGQASTVPQEPQGSWVGKLGSGGYLLAGWDGAQDISDTPNVTASLVKGSRWQWAQNTSDVRALQSPDGLTRNASTYYDPNQILLKLSFKEAYSGNLHLYAVDWDSTARRETISVNGQGVALVNSFNQGAWLSYPISVSAGGTVTVMVNRTAGANAVLSGIFLGEGGSPPAATMASAPQGSWVGKLGSAGYDLAGWDGSGGDVAYLPKASLSLAQGSRWQWAQNTSDPRALSDPGALTRNAGTYYDPNQIKLTLTPRAGYTGTLHLYAVDWDHGGRREIITVNGQSAVLGEFSEGGWVSFPISVPAFEPVTITVDRTAGANAVLSGIFLGEAGTPPGPTVASAPQGAWVNAVGSAGYDLAGWDGSQGDASYLPNASVSLMQGSRYQWAANSADPRALSDPTGLTHNAGTYYDPNEIRLKLTFPAKFSGKLRLYAVDWDHGGRREIITVDGQRAVLGEFGEGLAGQSAVLNEFGEGAWVSFPIAAAAGETVTITVDRMAGANAVLSGIFLGEAGPPPAMASTSAPQGSWVGTYGSAGYDLAGWNGESDLASMSSASVGLAQGSRYVWASSTEDVRALQGPEKTTRDAATYYDPNDIQLRLSFANAYTGNLRLYAVDWDSTARRELISVNGQTAALSSEFNQGAWVTFPISVAAGETVSIVVDRTAGSNAVLSGIFLG